MYKEDLALNNLQWLICHKTKLNQTYWDYYLYSLLVIFCELDDFLYIIFVATELFFLRDSFHLYINFFYRNRLPFHYRAQWKEIDHFKNRNACFPLRRVNN